MEKDGACEMDRQTKNAILLEREGEGRIMLEVMKKRKKKKKKKLAGPLAKKELPAGGCSRRNGKPEEGSRQKKISEDRQHHDKWTISRYEKEG